MLAEVSWAWEHLVRGWRRAGTLGQRLVLVLLRHHLRRAGSRRRRRRRNDGVLILVVVFQFRRFRVHIYYIVHGLVVQDKLLWAAGAL
jgi:hypothetical protein